MQKDIPSLDIIEIDLTNKCNFMCRHCRANARDIKKEYNEFDYNLLIRTIDELIDLDVPTIVLAGGEPLLYPKIIELVNYIVSNGSEAHVTTNGYLHNTLQALINSVENPELLRVAVSIYGPEVYHDSFCGVRGAYNKAIKSLEICIKHGIITTVNFTVTKGNIRYVFDYLNMAENMGANVFKVRTPNPIGRATTSKDIFLSTDEWFTILKELVEEKEKRNIEIEFADPLWVRFDKELISAFKTKILSKGIKITAGCTAGISSLYISSDGSVRPCAYFPYNLGSIKETTISRLWEEHPLLNSLRKRELHGECGECTLRGICGGCRGRTFCLTGDPMASDSYCMRPVQL
ncbi:radical SAM/SPASM domain-containing protein [Thermococcus sp.]|nr:radical SAM protein [Thermococcus sp.]